MQPLKEVAQSFKSLANIVVVLTLLVSAGAASAQTDPPSISKKQLDRFEKQIDVLRERLKIPGLSAVIVKDQKVLWEKGFGFADLENRVPATPDTLYSIASVTKTFASTLIMQLVQQGKLDLDEPISHYSNDFKDDSVKIKHLITHTSIGTPGEKFQYDGGRYDYLTKVIEKKTGKPFVNVVVDTFFDPLGMSASVPYHNIVEDSDKWIASLGKEHLDRYQENLEKFAQPYTYYGEGEILHEGYPSRDYNGASAGLISSVRDLAKYDIAIDRHVLLKKKTQEKAWTPFTSNTGERLPYGLGWFVTDDLGLKVVWHYGDWGSGFSAMYIKIPAKNVSVIMLANSEALADHGGWNLMDNVFGCSVLSFWGHANGCEQTSEAALAKWKDRRRAYAHVAIQVDAKVLEPYVGKYQFEALQDRIFTVTLEGGKLFVQQNVPHSVKTELLPESESKFFVKARPYEFIFTKAAGQAAQLDITQDGQVFHSKRVQ
jgi:CubicO group peptidase (beta-lactamase class C family)